MDQILIKVHTVDPNNSEAVKEVLSVFFQNVIKQKEFNCSKWLREIQAVINRFPKYCMSHRNNIEGYLAFFITSYNYSYIVETAKCAHSLQQVRPTKEKTATPKSSWRDQIVLLTDTAHMLISAIFPNAVDMYKDNDLPEETPAPKSPLITAITDLTKKFKNTQDKHSQLQARLKNIFIFIQAMLVEIYPVAKPVQPQIIIDVIKRALSVTSGMIPTDVDIATIKIQALRTLDALIMCLGSNLIPYSPLVIRFVMLTLRWTFQNPTAENRKVRAAAYNTLSNWLSALKVLKNPESNKIWEEELIRAILIDVIAPKKVIELTMGPQPTKNLSKKAKRKLATTQLQDSTIAARMPGERQKMVISEERDSVLAIAALGCAETFFTVAGRFLKPQIYKVFQSRLIRECFDTSYDNDYFLYLLRAVEAARKTTPATIPPPTQYCLQLYSMLANVPNAEISKFCTQSLLDIRMHLHCSPPSLNFAIQVPRATERTPNTQKKISERNKAMLKTLLGKDRVLTKANEKRGNDEVIDIAEDQPANKKPKMEAEKISLSSDNGSSVEISDDDDVMEVAEIVESPEKASENFDENADVAEEDEDNTQENADEKIEEEQQENDDDEQEDDEHSQESEENRPDNDENGQENVENRQDNVENGQRNVVNDGARTSIHEAQTQIVEEENLEDQAGNDFYALELDFEYPNSIVDDDADSEENEIENLAENEILSNPNETDDMQLALGQEVRDSQEIDTENNETHSQNDDINPLNSQSVENTAKVNGDGENIVENGVDNRVEENSNVPEDIDSTNAVPVKDGKIDGVSVDEMLADFVDEVVEEETA